MNIALLLDMMAGGAPDRVAVGSREGGLTYEGLRSAAHRAAAELAERQVATVVLVDANSPAVPVLLFGSAVAGIPFTSLNFRLADPQLRAIMRRTTPSVAVLGEGLAERLGPIEGMTAMSVPDLLAAVTSAPGGESEPQADADDVAVLLFTSGTTAEPKAALLRHRHLFSYVCESLEFMAAGEEECALVSVPSYHIAGLSAVLSSVYVGRRLFYLPQFDEQAWVEAARSERVTHAMVVPTMLGRILDAMDDQGVSLPDLRHLSYGGGRMPVQLIERALGLLPDVDFVNAYGLTETSSTITVLTPQDHRDAVHSDDPRVRRRLGSVGRALGSIEVSIRDDEGKPVPSGQSGEVYVRGDQVAGEYQNLGSSVLSDGWFPTRDGGHLDEDGYLFIDGRVDDVIVRGGENISPGEVEDVLVAHPAVAEAAVIGAPDVEWGEAVIAVVVVRPDQHVEEIELLDWVGARLRSSRRPARVEFRSELPYNETGKLLRRVLKAEVAHHAAAGRATA